MKSKNIEQVIRKFFQASYPAELTETVQRWLIDPNHQEEKEKTLQNVWEELEVQPNASFKYAWKMVKKKAGLTEAIHRKMRWMKKVAAVILPILLVSGGSLYFFRPATWVKVQTHNNEQKHFRLPDNSEVWLNSGSQLVYKKRFQDTVRQVILAGEAYFRVYRDTTKPFIVETSDFKIQALGTEFNVHAYSSDSRSVATLNEGKIQVHLIADVPNAKSYILEPLQQVIFYKDEKKAEINTISRQEENWKEGNLVFRDATLPDIVNTLQRHFNVVIDYPRSHFPDDLYTVKFVDHENIAQILDVLQDVIGFRYVRKNSVTYQLEKN